MQCPQCQCDNLPPARFCSECGMRLLLACAQCGAQLPPGAKFCLECGASLAAAPTEAGERRQLTLLFSDLVGSTELSARLDPEEWRDRLAEYHHATADVVTRFGGTVAKYLGDGILALFGYPQAHEDDAERAVRAGLEIVEVVRSFVVRSGTFGEESPFSPSNPTANSLTANHLPTNNLSVRIGIHTGLTVIADVGGRADVFGETPNVAARVQHAAASDTVVITAATQRLVAGLFVVEDRGPQMLKGVREPVTLYRVVQPSGVRSRLDVAAGRLTPFVGREVELATLIDRWERAQDGEGQCVLVLGEAGVGKSRLVYQLHERLAAVPHTWLECGATSYTEGTPFHPVLALTAQALAFAPADTLAERLRKLEVGLGALASAETVALLADFLGVAPPTPLQMSPELQRRKTIELLAQWTLSLSAAQPLVVVVEDLHWCDASTLELLGHLIAQSPTARVLLLATARPDFTPPWPTQENLTTLSLTRLTKRQARDMIATLAGAALPAATLDALVARAEGVPLFVEELTRSVVEPGTARGVEAIPASLADSLMGRLDRLSTAKEVAQRAAVLGREFEYPLLAAMAGMDEAALRHGLARLVEAEILFARGEPPAATYTFKHALLQDTAYASLLKSRRRELHARIAKTLTERFPQRAAAEPELLAHHSAAGGLLPDAIEAYRRAGDQAAARIAYREAYGYFARALELLAALPQDSARDEKEIELRTAQVGPLGALRGFDDPELRASIERTDALLAGLGPGPQQIPGLLKLMILHTNRLARAREYANALLAVVEPLGIAPLCMAGYIIRGTAATVCATVPEACADLKRAHDIAETIDLPTPKTAFEIDALAMGSATYAIALVLAGKPDTAGRYAERGIRRARELGHPRTLVSASNLGALAYQLAGNARRVGEIAEETLKETEGRGFHQVEVLARVMTGWARARSGDPEAVARMDEALEGAEAHGVLAGMPRFCFASAELHLLAGRPDRALAQVTRGEVFMNRSGERFTYEPEALMMRGQILLDSGGDLGAAEAALRRAYVLWERNQSPWMLIRAATLLARLSVATGTGKAEASERLARLYAGFDEGFETERLHEARRVMDLLRSDLRSASLL